LQFDFTTLLSRPTTPLPSKISAGMDIANLIPHNCTIGTESFCIGFSSRVKCHQLPLNLSYELSQALPSVVSYPLEPLHKIDASLAQLTSEHLKGLLIVGLASAGMLYIAVLPLWYIEWATFREYNSIKAPLIIISLVSSVSCVFVFLSLVVILYSIVSKTRGVLINITAEGGMVFRDCLLALLGAIIMAIYTTFRFGFALIDQHLGCQQFGRKAAKEKYYFPTR
jgi:hypothetical protein